MIQQIVRQSSINSENSMLMEAFEVVIKMVSHLGYKETESM